MNLEKIGLAIALRKEGRSIRFIADEFGVSRMSVWRSLDCERNKNAADVIIKELFK